MNMTLPYNTKLLVRGFFAMFSIIYWRCNFILVLASKIDRELRSLVQILVLL
jgi:hypothetical protein